MFFFDLIVVFWLLCESLPWLLVFSCTPRVVPPPQAGLTAFGGGQIDPTLQSAPLKVRCVTTSTHDTLLNGLGVVWEMLWESKNSNFVTDILKKSSFQEIDIQDVSETPPRRVRRSPNRPKYGESICANRPWRLLKLTEAPKTPSSCLWETSTRPSWTSGRHSRRPKWPSGRPLYHLWTSCKEILRLEWANLRQTANLKQEWCC